MPAQAVHQDSGLGEEPSFDYASGRGSGEGAQAPDDCLSNHADVRGAGEGADWPGLN